MGYLGATLTQMSQYLRWETGLASANEVTNRKRAEDLGIFLKKSVSRVETCLGRKRLTFACPRRPWVGVAWMGGGQMEKPE